MESNHEKPEVMIPFEDEEETVCIPVSEYRELVIKANALDILADDIRCNIDHDAHSYDIVNYGLVRTLTGTKYYVKPDFTAAAPEASDE